MRESPDSGKDPSGDPPPIARVRTEEPQAPVGQDEPNPNVVSDATADEKAPGEQVDPGIGGYADRDPKTDMPRMPSVPETQD
jgi:hypothetical protein